MCPEDVVAPSAAEATPVDAVEPVEGAIEGESTEEVEPEVEAKDGKKLSKKDEKKSNKKKYKLKVDGKEFEEEVDLDNDDYVTKQFQMAKAAQKRMSEYTQLEKEVTEFLDQLKKNPRKVLQDPRIGLDLKKLAAEMIEDEILQSQKSPEQVKQEELESKLRELEEDRKKEQEQFRQKEFERLQEQEFQRYDKSMSDALEKSDLPKSPYIIKKMADYMLMGINKGMDVTPEDVLPLVREEMQTDLKEMFAIMPDEVIEAIVGKDVITRLRKKSIAKAKNAPIPLKNGVKDSGQTKKDDKQAEKRVSYRDFFGI